MLALLSYVQEFLVSCRRNIDTKNSAMKDNDVWKTCAQELGKDKCILKDTLRLKTECDLWMQVVFREAKNTDLPLIKKFTVDTGWKDMPENQRRSQNREEWSRHMIEVFENLASRKDSKIFVAEDERHTFLGYLFVGEGFDTMTGTIHGFIYDLFVTEECRGKGIGKTLIEKAETYCRERGYPRILLMVSAENKPAIRLYTKTGFKTEHMYMGKELG